MTNEKGNKSTLQQLYANRPLCTKVDNLIDEGKTIAFLQEFCKNQGFEISTGSLNNYKKKREEAIRTGVPLESLLDKRQTNGEIVELYPTDDTESILGEDIVGFADTEKRAVNTLTFLEDIIARSAKAIEMTPVLDPALGMKAVDLHHKISGGNAGGLTVFGIQEMRLKIKAIETAYMSVLLEFVPESDHEKVYERFEEAEQAFYDNLDLTEEGRKMREALKDVGLG